MKIKDVAAAIESFAPTVTAEEWDNVGLMLGDANAECTGVTTCLDCTLDVAKQAKEKGCNLIVTHHPFIFKPMTRLTLDEPKARVAEFLFANKISVYSAHTNLDAAAEGLNCTLATIFGGSNIKTEGCGCFADVTEDSAGNLAKKVANALGDPTVKVGSPDKKVSRIYIVSGAGGGEEELGIAMERADALVTGEVKHHVYVQAAERDFPVVEFSHHYSEIICCGVLKRMINSVFGDLNVVEAYCGCPYKTLEEL